MAEIALRLPALPPALADLEAWHRAGVAELQVPLTALPGTASGANLAPIALVPEVSIFPPRVVEGNGLRGSTTEPSPDSPGAEGRWRSILVRAITPDFAFRHMLGQRAGRARLCELDLFVLGTPTGDDVFRHAVATHGGDPDRVASTTERYLRARHSGYAVAELPATEDAVGLLYGADTMPVIGARTAYATDAVRGFARRRLGSTAERMTVELDPLPADGETLARAFARDVDDGPLVVAPEELGHLTHAALSARKRGIDGVVLRVPSDAIHDSEGLADALDVLDGIGIRRVVLATNAGWLDVGARVVERAVNRLTGRRGDLEPERQRRTELREA